MWLTMNFGVARKVCHFIAVVYPFNMFAEAIPPCFDL